MDNKEIRVSNTESRNWEYQKNGCILKFVLRTDIKDEMKTYIELLRMAADSVEEELAKRFPKQ